MPGPSSRAAPQRATEQSEKQIHLDDIGLSDLLLATSHAAKRPRTDPDTKRPCKRRKSSRLLSQAQQAASTTQVTRTRTKKAVVKDYDNGPKTLSVLSDPSELIFKISPFGHASIPPLEQSSLC